MSLSWQEVACGLPVPALPLPSGCCTRFFTAALEVPAADLPRLQAVARRLLEEGCIVRLPDGEGADWPCRLTALPDVLPDVLPDAGAAAGGRRRVRLEFEVVEPGAA